MTKRTPNPTGSGAIIALLILPVMLGVWLGSKVMDRVDPVLFRKMTLLVLMVAGLNLIRRAIF